MFLLFDGFFASDEDASAVGDAAPAAAVVGDIVELPGEPPFGALSVAVGNGRVLGYHQDAEGAEILQPTAFLNFQVKL